MTQEQQLMTEEEFKNYMYNSLNIRTFDCVGRFRSVLRAARRGHVNRFGVIIPKRPFNNRKPTRGRRMNELKKRIYYDLTGTD